MSYTSPEGINISYDYSDLIEEINLDIEEGTIAKDSVINIVRNKKSIKEMEYYPICDYYLSGDLELTKMPLEDLYNKEEYSEEEWSSMEKERVRMIKQYEDDKPFFDQATVLAVLTEMEEWNSIL